MVAWFTKVLVATHIFADFNGDESYGRTGSKQKSPKIKQTIPITSTLNHLCGDTSILRIKKKSSMRGKARTPKRKP